MILFFICFWHDPGICRMYSVNTNTIIPYARRTNNMGRMRENPRYNVISMRVSDEEREQLESLVQRTHKSVSDIMREAMVALTIQLDHRDYRKAA